MSRTGPDIHDAGHWAGEQSRLSPATVSWAAAWTDAGALTAPYGRNEPVLVPAEGGERLDLGRSAPHVLLSGEMSSGRLSVLEVTQGAGSGPPLHVHSREDESFYVLGGSFVFRCGDTSWEGGRGAFVSLPVGIPHQYKAGEQGGTLLMMFTPSGMEDYFREWAHLVAEEGMTDAAMEELAAHHGLQLLQPYPPAAVVCPS